MESTATPRFLRLPEVCLRTGHSRSTIFRKEDAGDFPKRVHTGPNTVAWVEAEVDAYIKGLIAARDGADSGDSSPELPHSWPSTRSACA